MSLSPWISFFFFLFFHFFTFSLLRSSHRYFCAWLRHRPRIFFRNITRVFLRLEVVTFTAWLRIFLRMEKIDFEEIRNTKCVFYERDNIKFTSVYGINCFTFFDTVGIMIQNNIRNFFYHSICVSWFLFFFLFQSIKSIEFYISLLGLFFFLVGKLVGENFHWKISWVYIYGISLRKYDVERHARIRVRFYCFREVHRQSIYLLLSFQSLPRVFSIDWVNPNNTFKTIQRDRNNKK